MKLQTSFIPLLASLAVLSPRAGLTATPVSGNEKLATMGHAGELSVEPLELAQTQNQNPQVLFQIAVALAKVGQFDRSLEIARTITDERWKSLGVG